MIDQIRINTADRIEVDIYSSGILTTPTSIKIATITDPNGVVRATDITPTAGATTGRYYYTIPLAISDTLGIYTAVWEFVIDSITYQHTQQYEVVSSIREGYVVPQEIRNNSTYSQITATDPTDAVLQKYIDRSTILIDNYLGGSIEYTTYAETRRCVLDKKTDGLHIQLSHRPIVSVTSVTVRQEPDTDLVIDVDTIRTNKEVGYLELFGTSVTSTSINVCLPLNWTDGDIIPEADIVYTAGYTYIPDDLKTAAIMLVEELYKQSKGEANELDSFTLGDQKEKYHFTESRDQTSDKLGLNNASAIRNILNQYRQPQKSAGIFGILG